MKKYLEFLRDKGGRKIDLYSYESHFRYYLLNYKQFLPKNKNVRILDIGCGLGHFLYFCLKLGYSDITGIDIDPEMVEFCKRKLPGEIKVELINSISEYLGNKSCYYDLISMNDVLEHINKEEIITTLKYVYDSLSSDGCLIIKTINAANLLSGWTRYGDFTHQISFTEWSLMYLLTEVGFQQNKIKFYSEKYVVNTPKQFCRALLRGVLDKLTKFIFKIEKVYVPKVTTSNIIVVCKK